MDPFAIEMPRFESLSPSGRYAELTDYCVDQLEGILLLMLDSDDPRFQPGSGEARDLLETLGRRQRTLHNGFLFQLRKLFSDFKSIRPARILPRNPAAAASAGLFDTHGSQVQPLIQGIDRTIRQRLEPRLRVLDLRMKYLVHRSDDGLDDNPLAPANLCNAFVAAIEPLGFNRSRSLPLLEAFGELLEQQLGDLYRECDRGLHELGIRFDLPFEETDPAALEPPEAETEAEDEIEASPPDRNEPGHETTDRESLVDEPSDDDQAEGRETVAETEAVPLPDENLVEIADAAAVQAAAEPDPTLLREPPPAIPVEPAAVAETLPEAGNETETDLVGQAVAEILAGSKQPEEADSEAEEEPSSEVDTEGETTGQLLTFASRGARLLDNESVRVALDALKENTEALDDDLSAFHACIQQLQGIVPEGVADDLQKFSHFYSGLVGNPRVSDPLRRQLLRLATPLLHLVLHDPFFFRSSSHPVNDFLHSMIDFEIRHGHRPENIKVLALLVDNLLALENPMLSDFLPITQGYEVFKQLEVERLREEKKNHEAGLVRLRRKLIKWVHELIGGLEVGKDTLAFFHDDWKLYLQQLARQYGEHSNEVQDALELARILAWSLNRNRSENAHYAAQRFTGVLRKVDLALRSLDYSHAHRQRIRRTLIREFRDANCRPTLIQAVTPVQTARPAVQPFFGQLGAERPRWARPAVNVEPALYPDVASMIQIGDWIEIKPQPGSRSNNPQRGKLRWQSTDGIYRFFNQRGSIILEIDAEGLNRMFARGEASLLKPFSSTGLGGSLGSGFRIYH